MNLKMTDVIRRPLITEKTSLLREDGRTLVFHVAPGGSLEVSGQPIQLSGNSGIAARIKPRRAASTTSGGRSGSGK